MSARVVVSCDSEWNGMPCRGFRAARPDDSRYPVSAARLAASDVGWSQTVDGRDLCPACTRAAAERTVERLAAEAPALTRDEAVASALPSLPPEWHAELAAVGSATAGRRVRLEMTDRGLVAYTDPHPDLNAHMAAMRAEHEARLHFQPVGRSPLRVAVDVLRALGGAR